MQEARRGIVHIASIHDHKSQQFYLKNAHIAIYLCGAFLESFSLSRHSNLTFPQDFEIMVNRYKNLNDLPKSNASMLFFIHQELLHKSDRA